MTTISTFNNDEVFKKPSSIFRRYKITRCDIPYHHGMLKNNIKLLEKYQIQYVEKTILNEYENMDLLVLFVVLRILKTFYYDTRCEGLLRVCPGITFHSHNHGQSRTTNPKCAQELGADYAVIGRSVTQAHDPVETMEKIKKTLAFKLVSEKL